MGQSMKRSIFVKEQVIKRIWYSRRQEAEGRRQEVKACHI